MALTTGEMSAADLAAIVGGENDGFGGNNAWWIILFFLLCMNGGWNNGFGGNTNGGVPYIANDVQRGFDQSAIMGGLTGIQSAVTSGFGDIQTALCGGFAGVNAGIANGFAQAEIADNARQMASMNQMFGVQSALQNCCCENRAGLADVKYTVATEACADRQVVNDALRDVIMSNTANTQAILDKLCQQELEAERRENANLRSQVNMLNLAQSQTAQTAQLLADNSKQTAALEQYLNPAPIPAYVVQNPNCCTNVGCGCGM